jgi:uracil phosphoribosyltransferase
MALNIVEHPLARHLLALLRNVGTPPEQFRTVCKSLTTLVVLEATRNLPSASSRVTTPLAETEAQLLARPLAVIPVLRAGLGMLDPVTQMFPDVAVGYIGLERHETTGVAHSYYCKLPELKGKDVLCLDPMLATGGSAAQALALIKAQSPASVAMVSIIAAPEGARRLERDHPDVEAFVAVLDEGLDDRMFIVPGLGDFGDRLYGTF